MLPMLLIVPTVFMASMSINNTTDQMYTLPEPSLKKLAQDHSIEIGNFAIRNLMNEPNYKTILTTQFDLALLDNTPNWYFTDGGLRPSATEYNFIHMDEVVNYAETNGMKMQAHHLLWGEEKWLPDWLKNGNYSKEQLDNLMHDHIQTVAGRYNGRIQQWTVVNEAFSRGQNINGLRDWWGDATGGKDYIDSAFIWARQADPNAVLILNDFGNETQNSVSDEMYTYIKNARQRGVPIDAIGMQMHIDGNNPPSKESVMENMERFNDIGISVYVTEFDVTMNNVPGSKKQKEQKQAQIYYDMLRACLETDGCKSFALLGVTDKETWYNYMDGVKDPMPLPFDEKYAPKPAFDAMRKALEQ